MRARGPALEVGHLRELKAPFPVSAAVARFVDRLASLTPEEWAAIQHKIGKRGVDLTMIEASRNAAVALAVRDLITRDQFNHLYRPFRRVIPPDSLDLPPNLD
jgi:pyruvate/2-oxoglutarate/acetoin dehydrogenase E1 component